jgi:hypothetical protein
VNYYTPPFPSSSSINFRFSLISKLESSGSVCGGAGNNIRELYVWDLGVIVNSGLSNQLALLFVLSMINVFLFDGI